MKVLLLALLFAALLPAADPSRRAPGFAIVDHEMKLHDLYDYRGKPVVLEFMQSSCPHCSDFARVLSKVQQEFGDKVQILAVANPPDNFNTVARFIAAHQITYPILFDTGQVAYSYVLKGNFDLPLVFLIDAQGMIVNSYTYSPLTADFFEGDGLRRELEKLLPAPKAAPAKASPKKK